LIAGRRISGEPAALVYLPAKLGSLLELLNRLPESETTLRRRKRERKGDSGCFRPCRDSKRAAESRKPWLDAAVEGRLDGRGLLIFMLAGFSNGKSAEYPELVLAGEMEVSIGEPFMRCQTAVYGLSGLEASGEVGGVLHVSEGNEAVEGEAAMNAYSQRAERVNRCCLREKRAICDL
jgi:hypothetical protein